MSPDIFPFLQKRRAVVHMAFRFISDRQRNNPLQLLILFFLCAFTTRAQYTITVGPSASTYTRLALAFNAINAGTYTGAVHVQINGAVTETVKATLSPGVLVDSVMVYPVSSSTIQGSLNDDLIDLNGADRIYFDGRINRTGTVSALVISNTHTASLAFTFCFRNSATFNVLRYLNLQNSGMGAVRFSNSTSGSGNSDNIIERCFITKGASTPQNAIFSDGAFQKMNSRNKIRYNEITDYYSTTTHSNGIFLRDYNEDWEITNNSFYHTSARTSNYINTAIKVVSNTTSYLYKCVVQNNFIGGTAPLCAGPTSTISSLIGVDFLGSSNLQSVVSNNTIRGLNLTTNFTGINVRAGKVLVQNNFIGDSLGTGAIVCTSTVATITGVYVPVNDSVKVYDNKIGAITASCSIVGVDISSPSGLCAATVTGNIIGSRVTPNSINCESPITATIAGIRNTITNGAVHYNFVMNMATTNVNGANSSIYGIVNVFGYNQGNQVAYLTTQNQGTVYAVCRGIWAFEAKDNFVHHLEALTSYYSIQGISAYTAVNNIISLGFGLNSAAQFFGIWGNTGVNAGYYHNTVCLGGTDNSNALNTCIFGGTDCNSNIFYCARTRTLSTSGTNYAAYNIGSGQYNTYYVSGTSGSNIVAWSGGVNVSTFGVASNYSDPMLTNVGSNQAYHYKPGIVLNGTNTYGGFVLSVPKDYFGFTRPNPPTMGAIEKTTCFTVPVSKTVYSCTPYTLGNQTYSLSGTYVQTFTYTNACDTLVNLTLEVGVAPVNLTVSQNTTCAGQNNTITASGASGYTWTALSTSNASVIVSPLITTIYTVVASNTLGCTKNFTVQLNVVPVPTISFLGGSVCLGNSFTFSPTGATSYTFLNGGPIVTPASTAMYTVAGSGTNNCVSYASAGVTVNPLPVLSVNSGTLCAGQTFTLVPNNAVSYVFPVGGPQVSPANTSTYSIIGTDVNGCVGAITASVTVFPLPTISVSSGSVCSGSSFTLQPSGGVSYIYQNGGPVVSPVSTTIYSINSVNSNGCLSAGAATAQVLVASLPNVSLNSGALCVGDSFTFSPAGALSYTYLNGGPVVTPVSTSTFSVLGSDANGCSAIAQAQLTVNPLPLVSVNSGSVCLGNVFTLTPTGASSYNFPAGGPQIMPSVSQTYVVIGTDSNGCTATATSSVWVLQLPTVSVNGGSVCSGNAFTLQPSGGISYIYTNGGPVVFPLSTSVYTVKSIDASGCVSAVSATAQVTVVPLPTVSVVQSSTTMCAGELLELNANGADSYTWFNGALTQSIVIVSSVGVSTYTVRGLDSLTGCESVGSIQIIVDACTGIDKLDGDKGSVYPNPTRNSVTVNSPMDALLELTDLMGRVLVREKTEKGLFNLTLINFDSGAYLLTLRNTSTYTVYRIVKQD